MEDDAMEESSGRAIAARNKDNYLQAKAAFNRKDMTGCMSYYALDHQIRSRDIGPGRQHIERMLSSMHDSWPISSSSSTMPLRRMIGLPDDARRRRRIPDQCWG